MAVNFSSLGSVKVSQSLTITCTITTVERLVVTPLITFIKMNDTDMEMLSNLNRPYTITTDDTGSVTNYTLILDPVRFEDAGMYTCMAEFNVTGFNNTNDSSTATYDYQEASDAITLIFDCKLIKILYKVKKVHIKIRKIRLFMHYSDLNYQCMYVLVSFLLAMISLFIFILVPIPSVDVHRSRENYFLAGSNLILTCDISVDPNVIMPFTVNVTWNMTDQQIASSGNMGVEINPVMLADTDRVNISSVMMRSGFNEYRSTVNFTTLSSTEDSGTYTCIVTIVPDPVYEYVMTSDTNFMNINITVTGKYKIYICWANACCIINFNPLIPLLYTIWVLLTTFSVSTDL